MKIFGIGLNYFQHNKEIDEALYKLEAPVVFTKPDSAILKNGKPFFVPEWTNDMAAETEIVVRICKLGKSIPERFAYRYYDALTVGIDFTARDWLSKLRKEGYPWDMSKGFDGSAVLGEWVAKEELPDVGHLGFRLGINGETRQEGSTKDLVFGVDKLIAYISQYFTLKTGDLIYTGTPAGVPKVEINDHLTGFVEGRKVLEFNCK